MHNTLSGYKNDTQKLSQISISQWIEQRLIKIIWEKHKWLIYDFWIDIEWTLNIARSKQENAEDETENEDKIDTKSEFIQYSYGIDSDTKKKIYDLVFYLTIQEEIIKEINRYIALNRKVEKHLERYNNEKWANIVIEDNDISVWNAIKQIDATHASWKKIIDILQENKKVKIGQSKKSDQFEHILDNYNRDFFETNFQTELSNDYKELCWEIYKIAKQETKEKIPDLEGNFSDNNPNYITPEKPEYTSEVKNTWKKYKNLVLSLCIAGWLTVLGVAYKTWHDTEIWDKQEEVLNTLSKEDIIELQEIATTLLKRKTEQYPIQIAINSFQLDIEWFINQFLAYKKITLRERLLFQNWNNINNRFTEKIIITLKTQKWDFQIVVPFEHKSLENILFIEDIIRNDLQYIVNTTKAELPSMRKNAIEQKIKNEVIINQLFGWHEIQLLDIHEIGDFYNLRIRIVWNNQQITNMMLKK